MPTCPADSTKFELGSLRVIVLIAVSFKLERLPEIWSELSAIWICNLDPNADSTADNPEPKLLATVSALTVTLDNLPPKAASFTALA